MEQHNWVRYVNPVLGSLFEVLKLDKEYIRGDGTILYENNGNKIYDFLAGYGALPLGYHNKELWEIFHQMEKNMEPTFVIPSYLHAAGKLAKVLVNLVPSMSHVTFANSGSEALEWAIKLARMKTGKQGVLSATGGYHGKTLAALSATASANYQVGVGVPVSGFKSVPFGNVEELEIILNSSKEIAAFIIEPIQGEGGIVVPPEGYLERVRDLCTEHGVLLIIDEVQTGLGRTGSMFAYHHHKGVQPDILCLAKALGGGMMPIGAMLSSPSCFCELFFLTHSSTFAGGGLACRIAMKTIEILRRSDELLIKQVQKRGHYLFSALQDVITETSSKSILNVRGRGLLIGLAFTSDATLFSSPKSILLRVLVEQGLLGVCISSYLLNRWNIRVATALNKRNVIRVEPALTISMEQCDILVLGVKDVLSLLMDRNTLGLISHLVNLPKISSDSQKSTSLKHQDTLPYYTESKVHKETKDTWKWAYLSNPITSASWEAFDTSIVNAHMPDSAIDDLSRRFGELLEPFDYHMVNDTIFSSDTEHIQGGFVCLPRTNKELEVMENEQLIEEISECILFALAKGAKEILLGTHLSIILEEKGCLKDLINSFDSKIQVIGSSCIEKAEEVFKDTSFCSIVLPTECATLNWEPWKCMLEK